MPRPARRPGSLPAEATSFVGRRAEIAEARNQLSSGRLVTLVGPGGVGKTRLAIRIAAGLDRGFPDGSWLVELADLSDPALVPNAVLAALGLRDQTTTDPTTLLRSYLQERSLLLVLDNCEHLLDAVAQLAAEALRWAPGVRMIATSREPLAVAGEQVLPLAPLELPVDGAPLQKQRQSPAVMLFVELATQASGRFELTESNSSAVVALCRRLDGLPLAIELAASRTRALEAEEILDHLGDRFGLLTGGRAGPPRHRTLLATFEWSYDLLTAGEQTFLRRVSVFAGRFTVDDAESICADTGSMADDVVGLVSSLIDKSLLIKEAADAVSCYRLHQTLRSYAQLKLAESGEQDAVRLRYADHYLARCAEFGSTGRYRLPEWLAWAELEIDNLRDLLRHCVDTGDVRRGVDLASHLIWYWATRGTTEGVHWLDELFALASDRTQSHPWAHFVRGFLAVLQNDPVGARRALDRGIAAAAAAGVPDALAQSLAMASIAALMDGEPSASGALLDRARTVEAELGDPGSPDPGVRLMILQAEALNGLLDGDLVAVAAAGAEGARLSRETGDLYSLGMMLLNRGLAAMISGDLDAAGRWLAESLRVARRLDDRVAQCHLVGALGCCAAAAGDSRRAARLLGAMENLRAETGITINAGMAPAIGRATTELSKILGPTRFATEFAAGRRLDRDAATLLALGEAASGTAAGVSPGERVLARRETDVAQLVAAGLSNKQIGARLFISERTVESHVRSILRKLGFSSRAQIAAWISGEG